MTDALTLGTMSPEIRKVVDRARAEPEGRFHSLAHLIDVPALAAAYWRIRKDAAVGVDGVTKDQYGQDLERNLQDLYARLRSKRYRHQPIRRVHIPKDGGRTRPIGISALEDKMVQSAVRHVLEAIYEQDFLDCSFGFRAGRNAHAAIRALDKVVHRGEVNWILEADIVSFFDSLDRTKLKEMLQVRVTEGSLLRLIGKLLRVGVLDGEAYTTPDRGTAQGSGLSPLLGNVYLHYALDVWFDQVVRPRLRGRATLVRYADDFVIGFERRDDAERVMDVLPKRLGRYGLTLHADKTRVLPFGRPPHEIARTTVKRILHDHGIDPAPERSRRMPWRTSTYRPIRDDTKPHGPQSEDRVGHGRARRTGYSDLGIVGSPKARCNSTNYEIGSHPTRPRFG